MEKLMNYKHVRTIVQDKFTWEDDKNAPTGMLYTDEGVCIPNPEFVEYCKEKGYW